jgi:hypothetical protein
VSQPTDRQLAPAATAAGADAPRPDGAVLAVVKDLFFVARIRETARLAGVPLVFARTTDEVQRHLAAERPRFALLDLTGDLDHARVLDALDQAAVPVLAFTTHALARRTQPWHGRCRRVVTKEALTAELPALLREGVRG